MLHSRRAFSNIALHSMMRQRHDPPFDDRPVRVALIGTFAPRKCGIATFAEDLKTKVEAHYPNIAFDVYALDHEEAGLAYAPGVEPISVDNPAGYRAAAERINASGADAVWLQHEYGIFGGRDGAMVTEIVDRLDVPLIVTFHTILSQPSNGQRELLSHILRKTSLAMVMSEHGRNLLIDLYGVEPERITIIPHGAPDRPFGRELFFKAGLGLANRPVLMTFGLLGPGKGLEHAIEALPAIVSRHPDVLYRIVGATHPNLVREEGEAYRETLQALATRLGVEHNIAWDARFLETDELLDQLEACDIYLTPYPNLEQSTSGTLSYAVALGKAVVSTPYIHACELLADNVGAIVPVGDAVAIASTVTELLDRPYALAALKERAYAKGRSTIWPCFAQASANLLARAVAAARPERNSRSLSPVSGFIERPELERGERAGPVPSSQSRHYEVRAFGNGAAVALSD